MTKPLRRRTFLASAAATLAAPRVMAQARDKITYLTDFGYYGHQSYIFYALRKGY